MSVNKSKPQTTSQSSQVSKPITLQDTAGVAIVGNEAPVMITDAGAIEGSLNLAGLTVEKAAQLTLDLVSGQAAASRAALDSATQSQDKAYQFAMEAGRSDVATLQQTMKTVVTIAAIGAAAFVLARWVKK